MSTEEDPVQVAKLLESVREIVAEANSLQLIEYSGQVTFSVAGYILHKSEHLYRDCCQSHLDIEEVSTEYMGPLYHG